jgi:endonuclease/exonuclease/phosphatase family metal-dependent hydrolase
VKITTLNLQGFIAWEKRNTNILAYLKHEKPDVVLFQEVVFLPEIAARNQAQLLNAKLGYAYEHSVVSRLQVGLEHPVYREGLAAISKHPILKSDTIVLKQAAGDEHNRIVQLLDIFVNGQVIKLANVHFSLTDDVDFATAHLQETIEILHARGDERIIAGDFNLNHLEELAPLWQDGYHSSTDFPYISFPGMEKRNDYFLIPKKYRFGHLTTSDENLSDHNAVTTTIKTHLYAPFASETRDRIAARLKSLAR